MSEAVIAPTIVRPSFGERLEGWLPVLLVPVIALAGLALVGTPSTWLTLTAAGLAMGTMIFLMASGLTIVFGLMDVINFGHGAFIAVGAFVGVSVLARLAGWTGEPSVALNLAALAAALLVAMIATGALGGLVERVIVRPVYGVRPRPIRGTHGG